MWKDILLHTCKVNSEGLSMAVSMSIVYFYVCFHVSQFLLNPYNFLYFFTKANSVKLTTIIDISANYN